MKKILGLLFVIVFVSAINAAAAEFPYIYKGVRPMGMGGAFVALSDDANALFYNPAGLANIKTKRTSVFELEFEGSKKAFDYQMDAFDVDTDDPSDVSSFLYKYMGDYSHMAASFFPNYTRPNFAFGLISTVKSNMQVINPAYPSLALNSTGDVGLCAGYSHSWMDDSLLAGANLKSIYRKSLKETYSVSDITTHDFKSRLRDDIQDGGGILLDLGVIYKIMGSDQEEVAQQPLQLGMNISNLIGNKLGDAEDLDMHIDIGVSKRLGDFTLAADYVDLLGWMGDDNDVGKRIHLGLEYDLAKVVKLRAGINQGYLTYGIGAATKNMQFDLLSYAEEVGEYSGQDKDRRYLLRMGFGF